MHGNNVKKYDENDKLSYGTHSSPAAVRLSLQRLGRRWLDKFIMFVSTIFVHFILFSHDFNLLGYKIWSLSETRFGSPVTVLQHLFLTITQKVLGAHKKKCTDPYSTSQELSFELCMSSVRWGLMMIPRVLRWRTKNANALPLPTRRSLSAGHCTIRKLGTACPVSLSLGKGKIIILVMV